MEADKITQQEKKKTLAEREKELVEIYIKWKKSFIFAEETNPEFKTFLQPPIEINRAYDHLNRVLAARHGLVEMSAGHSIEEYVTDNFDKVKGHLYRAYFDVLDWISMNLRESIAASFKPYSKDAIQAVAPEYFSQVVPLVQELSEKIAGIRNNKDVVNSGTLKLLEEYEVGVETLKGLRADTNKKIPGLAAYESKKQAEEMEHEKKIREQQIEHEKKMQEVELENERKKWEAEKSHFKRELMIALWAALAGGLISWAIVASYT